jgi:hypothetical protein
MVRVWTDVSDLEVEAGQSRSTRRALSFFECRDELVMAIETLG